MTSIVLVLAGFLWWSLLEYLLHRFLFHRKNRFFGRRHLQHHARVKERLLALAPWPSAVIGAVLHAGLLFAFLDRATAAPLFVGFLGGYLLYEYVHYAVHYHRQRTPIGRWLRAYHMLHHHKTPKARYGVTSPVWDMVFGTYAPLERRDR